MTLTNFFGSMFYFIIYLHSLKFVKMDFCSRFSFVKVTAIACETKLVYVNFIFVMLFIFCKFKRIERQTK